MGVRDDVVIEMGVCDDGDLPLIARVIRIPALGTRALGTTMGRRARTYAETDAGSD
jgi:hypothetical protein